MLWRSDGSWITIIDEPIKILVVVLCVFSVVYVCKADPAYAGMADEQLGKHNQISKARSSQMTPPSEDQANISMRANYIRNLIEKNKGWGGHSPIPSRVTTAGTFKAVMNEISIADSAALMIVLQDDASEIRSMAASLLECLNPNAQSEIAKQITAETSSKRKSRLEEALIEIHMIQAGRTSCK